MKNIAIEFEIIVLLLLLCTTADLAAEQSPAINAEEQVIATVDDETITAEELKEAIGPADEDKDEKKEGVAQDSEDILRRLINVTLIALEAKNIGMDQLPDIKSRLDVFSRETLRRLLMRRKIKETKADEQELEKTYRESIKEWKIKSIAIEKEEDAKKAEEAIKRGGDYDEASKKLIAEGKARGSNEGVYFKAKDLLPEVTNTVSKMEVGSISPAVPVPKGYLILKLEDIRFPEDAEAREQIRQEIYDGLIKKALMDYYLELKKQYVNIDTNIFDSLDYESEEGAIQKLAGDERVIATVAEDEPVTVGEFTKAFRSRFFHGVGGAIQRKELNKKKSTALEDLLQKKLFLKEALKQGLNETREYKREIKEYERTALFEAFIKKAIAPEIKVKEEELKTYYSSRMSEFSFPVMLRIRSLAFYNKSDAEDGIGKMKKGTDYKWLKENSPGQVDANTKGLLSFGDKLLPTEMLEEEIKGILADARAGDLMIYESPQGHYYLLYVAESGGSKPKPFEMVKGEVFKKVYGEKFTKAVEDFADKLREVYDVKTYSTKLK